MRQLVGTAGQPAGLGRGLHGFWSLRRRTGAPAASLANRDTRQRGTAGVTCVASRSSAIKQGMAVLARNEREKLQAKDFGLGEKALTVRS